jgi:hypothetical protein
MERLRIRLTQYVSGKRLDVPHTSVAQQYRPLFGSVLLQEQRHCFGKNRDLLPIAPVSLPL